MRSLAEIETWLQSVIAPQAQHMDMEPQALFAGFRQLGDQDLLGLRLPKSMGGQGWDEATHSQFQILIASYSGSLAFLATQHQSAIRMLGSSPNEDLKQQLLPSLLQGKCGMGVGFSQLRRPGRPMMTATPSKTGFLLTGTVPWVTGFGCFDGFICGAVLPTQDILMGWVPLKTIPHESRLQISDPMVLSAMRSTQTVEVQLNHWPLDSDQVIAHHDPHWIRHKDQGNTLHHGFYALGAAKAALNLMSDLNSAQTPQEIQSAIASLRQHYLDCEARMFELLPNRRGYPEQCLEAKAEVIRLAGHCAQAAIALVGGGANFQHHPAQRIYRKVLAFTVFGQTPQSKRATLSAFSSF